MKPRGKFAQIGAIAVVMSGLFGIGGGTIVVPIAVLGLIQHTWPDRVLWIPGICLGTGGIIGAQIGTRLLPNISAIWINRWFRFLLFFLILYTLNKSWKNG